MSEGEPTVAATDPPPSSRRTLLRSSAVVAAGTGLSRVTGLLRTIVIAYTLGGALLGSTYNLANTTPNVVYDLVLGGILTATLVPVAIDLFDAGDSDAINAVSTVVTVTLVVLTVAATILSPVIIRFYTGFGASAARAHLQATVAVPLLAMLMPQVLFYGLTALWSALLNARRRFAAAAFAPVLNNVVVIGMLLALPHLFGGPITFERVRHQAFLLVTLGIGTTAGIVAMTLILWPALRRAGVHLRWRFEPRNPAVGAIARLSGWTLGYVVANQVVFVIVLAVLNGLPGTRGVSAYTNAWQFIQLPIGLFTVSIMTTFAPELATHASRGELDAYRDRFGQGLRLVTLVALPAAAVFLVLANPIVSVLLERGAFGGAEVAVTSSALSWLAPGLPGLAVFVYCLRGFYAFKDTRTPFVVNLIGNAVQVVLALALVDRYGLDGVMAGISAGYLVSAFLGLGLLGRRSGGLGGVTRAVVLQLLGAAVLVLVLWEAERSLTADIAGGDTLVAGLVTIAGLGIAAVLFVSSLERTPIRWLRLRPLVQRLSRRR